MAFVDNSPSFRTTQKLQLSDGGEGVWAMVLSGIDGDTPVYIQFGESGYMATALAASKFAQVGVPENGSIASGVVGLIRIKGYKAGVQAASAANFSGAAGGAVVWAGTTLHATATATALGIPNASDASGPVAILTETVSASTTANMCFTGQWATSAL